MAAPGPRHVAELQFQELEEFSLGLRTDNSVLRGLTDGFHRAPLLIGNLRQPARGGSRAVLRVGVFTHLGADFRFRKCRNGSTKKRKITRFKRQPKYQNTLCMLII